MGEFIFDNSWADAAYQNGINYYPKLLVGVPFTPATGARILLHPNIWDTFSPREITKLRLMVGSFLKRLAESNRISSIHLNFVTDEEATDLSGKLPEPIDEESPNETKSLTARIKRLVFQDRKDDYLRRTSLQYHWSNSNVKDNGRPYGSFDDYLGCFKSKRRITIRRERQKVRQDENIRIDAIVGKDIIKYEGLVEKMFDIYLSTVDRIVLWTTVPYVGVFPNIDRERIREEPLFHVCTKQGQWGWNSRPRTCLPVRSILSRTECSMDGIGVVSRGKRSRTFTSRHATGRPLNSV